MHRVLELQKGKSSDFVLGYGLTPILQLSISLISSTPQLSGKNFCSRREMKRTLAYGRIQQLVRQH